jgi:hypothetical protein
LNIILHCARGPDFAGDPCHYGESHAGGLAQHRQQRWHGIDPTDSRDRLGNVVWVIHIQ